MYIPKKDDEENLDDIGTEDIEIDEEDAEIDDEGEAGDEEAEDEEEESDEPEDLAAAFKRVQGMDEDDPEKAVGDPGEDEEDGDGEPEGLEEDDGYEDPDPDRGYAAADGGVDYGSVKQELISQLNKSAVAKAAKEFRDAGIREFQMKDVYERTPDGRVIYHNPDDPNRPFSSRMEAQSWIDSFNGQVKAELKRRALEIRNEDAGSVLPSLRLMDFAPSYDAMDDSVREMFDDLIEGYEVLDSDGKVIGYSCDLDKMAAKAERMASRFSQNRPAKRSAKRATKTTDGGSRQPSVDMRSHGSGGNGKMKREPQTLEEAMLRLRQQNK